MTKIIAHRGFAKDKKQNTITAFKHASESDAYGVETDIRITKDDTFVAFHDKSTARLCGRYKIIEKTNFIDLQKLKVFDWHRRHKIPTLLDFLQNCKQNNKIAIAEIKSNLSKEQIKKLIRIIDAEQYLPKTVFISFNVQILQYIRKLLPMQPIQLLLRKYKQEHLKLCQENKFNIDISHRQLTEKRVKELHDNGVEVNCWTVNSSKRSKILQQWGVDYITTDKATLSIKNNSSLAA